MPDARRVWARRIAFACAAWALVACKSYDAALLDDSTLDGHTQGGAGNGLLDGGAGDAGDAGNPSGSGGSGGNGGLLADGGGLSGCVENVDSDTCPILCPESCNNEDDDCDGKIDEDATAACELPHAVTACTGGECLIASCKGGYRNCDDETKNGCEAAADDIDNCGTCGHRCELLHSEVACKKDKCVEAGCKGGFDDCDDDEDGCETSATTLTNCSACGLPCTEGDVANAKPTCERGFCGVGECFMGFGDCNKAPGDGCEEALASLDHCGECGKKCDLRGSADDCSAGVCLAGACTEGYDDCDGNKANGCESLSADKNCGGCGKTCDDMLANVDGAGCGDETCELDCKDGFGDCDEDPGTGCETPITTRERCGDCDTPCSIENAVADCGSGKCTFVRCLPGWGDCNDDTSPDDGCETPLDTLANCGECKKTCNKASCGGGVCTAADCSTPPHDDDCGGTRCGNCDGDDSNCEANLNTSGTNCGACGNECEFAGGVTMPRANLSCSGGGCVASCTSSSFGNCDGDYRNGCERSLTTLTNCGTCGMGCAIANATPTCDTGSCRVSQCAADWADCNNDRVSCETPLGTTSNCTGCGGACNLQNAVANCAGSAGSHTCAIASCTQSYYADCDTTPGNGCEIDKRSSTANCGTCGNDCRTHPHVASATCGSGSCNYTCASGWGNCTSASGCETPLTTATDCGMCGIACARSNGTSSCSSGTCTLTGCDDGYANCDSNAQNGCEPLTSLNNCGACGAACTIVNGTGTCATQQCEIASCNAGWDDCDGDPDNGCERNVDPPDQGGQGPCLPDSTCTHRTYSNRDYYVCTGERTFSDARAHCQRQLLGDLVHIDDSGENAFLLGAAMPNDIWIGGSDSAVEGTWRWQNNNGVFWMGTSGGSATGYTNWNASEPNNSNNEDCAMLYASANPGKWNDTPCGDARDYVCEVQPDLCPDDPSKANPGQCGCGVADTDSDDDGTANCNDGCPNDTNKVTGLQCGCGNPETNSDTDPVADCLDQCPMNGGKTAPGECGCTMADTNTDNDSVADCNDDCPFDPSRTDAPCGYTYTPTNFDQTKLNFGGAPATTLDCQTTTTIDTGTNANPTTDTSLPTISNWCGTPPTALIGTQTGGPNVVIIPLQGLTIAASRTLRVIGNRPVILAVRGDVSISGTINAKGIGATTGAGGNVSCSGGRGSNGSNDGNSNEGGGGGGGGGFGAAGNVGGRGNRLLGSTNGGAAGATEGSNGLSPLRGGCSGGKGGNGNGTGGAGGGGGGAIQISASGTLTILQGGIVTASGGGGLAATNQEDAGGGGGSGGSVLLEGGSVVVNTGAWVTANGGGGASGSSTSGNTSAPGTDGFANNTQRAPGGPGSSGGGNGGGGGANQGGAQGGGDGDFDLFIIAGGGGGGGGGGVGRVRVHGASTCSLSGTFSPTAMNACP